MENSEIARMDSMTFREPDAAARLEKLLEGETAHSIGYRLKSHSRRGDSLRVLQTLCSRCQGDMRAAVLEVMVHVFPDSPATRDAMRQALLVENDFDRWFRLLWFLGKMQLTGIGVALVVLDRLAQTRHGENPRLPLDRPSSSSSPSTTPFKKSRSWVSRLLGGGRGASPSSPSPLRSPQKLGMCPSKMADQVAQWVSSQKLGSRRLTDEQVAILQRFNKRFGQRLGGVGGTPGVALDAAQISSRCRGDEGLSRLQAMLQEPERLREVTSSCPPFLFKMSIPDFEDLWARIPIDLHTLLGPALLTTVTGDLGTDWIVATLSSTESEVLTVDLVRLLSKLVPGYRIESGLVARLQTLYPDNLALFREKLWSSFEPGSEEFPRWEARVACSTAARVAACVLPGGHQIALSTASAITIFDLLTGRVLALHQGDDLPLLMLSFAPGRWLAETPDGGVCELSLEGSSPAIYGVEGGTGWKLQPGDWVTGKGDRITAVRENRSCSAAEDTVAQIGLRCAFPASEGPNLEHFRLATGGLYHRASGPRFDAQRRLIWGYWNRRLAISSVLHNEGDEETTLWLSTRRGPTVLALEQVTSEEVCLHVWTE